MKTLLWFLSLAVAFLIIATIRFIPVPLGKQPSNDLAALRLSRGMLLRQSFKSKSDYLEGIGMVFLRPRRRASGELTVTLSAVKGWDSQDVSSSSERRLAIIKVPVSKLQPERETVFRFARQEIGPGETLILSLSATSPPGEAVVCMVSKQNYLKDAHLTINGKRASSFLVFQIYHPESLIEIFSRLLQRNTKFYPLLDARVLPWLFMLLFFLVGWWMGRAAHLDWISEQSEFDYYREI